MDILVTCLFFLVYAWLCISTFGCIKAIISSKNAFTIFMSFVFGIERIILFAVAYSVYKNYMQGGFNI